VSHAVEGKPNGNQRALSLTDFELVERAKGGDTDAFRTLYDMHVDRIYRLATRMVGDPALAQDFTQDTFVRAWQRLPDFRGDAAFSTWLHSIAVSVTLNGMRSADRHRKRERPLDEAVSATGRSTRPEPDVRERLHRAVDALAEIYRTVFLMHDLEGYSHDEIALALGIAQGTSKARLFRARAKLRNALGDAMKEYV
jgi:RNA polymerase sigma-70 factor (ECF subfamily)